MALRVGVLADRLSPNNDDAVTLSPGAKKLVAEGRRRITDYAATHSVYGFNTGVGVLKKVHAAQTGRLDLSSLTRTSRPEWRRRCNDLPARNSHKSRHHPTAPPGRSPLGGARRTSGPPA